MSTSSAVFSRPWLLFTIGFSLRLVLLCYGIYQDNHSALKYTDIDYFVFTDASRYMSEGRSPYDRDTYRYTPLLAWLLLPTAWGGLWFHFGKALFAMSDLVAGWLIWTLLKGQGMTSARALKFASVWLLNPMVANISTRGSSEGLLCVLVMALLWAYETRRIALAGMLLGTCVHFKIYPFIYGASMFWALESPPVRSSYIRSFSSLVSRLLAFFNHERQVFLSLSLATFTLLNATMYYFYGSTFIHETFTYHLTRLDHRHNFSPYNIILYLSSASATPSRYTSFAFIPQLLLSVVLIPLACARPCTISNPSNSSTQPTSAPTTSTTTTNTTSSQPHSTIPSTLLLQTLTFVTFNKVTTSQYFLWYLILLPLHLPSSRLLHSSRLGLTALSLWILAQALWLWQAYELEFLGKSTFFPGLWGSSLVFFVVNCWIIGVVIQDVVEPLAGVDGEGSESSAVEKGSDRKRKERVLVMPPATGKDAISPNVARTTATRRRKADTAG